MPVRLMNHKKLLQLPRLQEEEFKIKQLFVLWLPGAS